MEVSPNYIKGELRARKSIGAITSLGAIMRIDRPGEELQSPDVAYSLRNFPIALQAQPIELWHDQDVIGRFDPSRIPP